MTVFNMPKEAYCDRELLEEYISHSKYKIGAIVSNLGISRQAFDKKRKGRTPFRASEIFVLCEMLEIYNPEDKIKIFCSGVEKKVDSKGGKENDGTTGI